MKIWTIFRNYDEFDGQAQPMPTQLVCIVYGKEINFNTILMSSTTMKKSVSKTNSVHRSIDRYELFEVKVNPLNLFYFNLFIYLLLFLSLGSFNRHSESLFQNTLILVFFEGRNDQQIHVICEYIRAIAINHNNSFASTFHTHRIFTHTHTHSQVHTNTIVH